MGNKSNIATSPCDSVLASSKMELKKYSPTHGSDSCSDVSSVLLVDLSLFTQKDYDSLQIGKTCLSYFGCINR